MVLLVRTSLHITAKHVSHLTRSRSIIIPWEERWLPTRKKLQAWTSFVKIFPRRGTHPSAAKKGVSRFFMRYNLMNLLVIIWEEWSRLLSPSPLCLRVKRSLQYCWTILFHSTVCFLFSAPFATISISASRCLGSVGKAEGLALKRIMYFENANEIGPCVIVNRSSVPCHLIY